LLLTAAAGAQRFRIVTAGLQAEPPRPSMIAAPAPEEGRIGLDVVVTDKGGKPISGLELKDFSLFDNNQPVKVLSFQAVDSAQVIILLDAVNLGYLALAQTRDEVAKFLRRNGGHLAQPVSVVLLNNTGLEVLMQASTDGNALTAELDKAKGTFRTIGNSGGISGASERFNLCIKWLAVIANGEREDPGRKLLIWTGPGYPKLDMASVNTSPKGVRLLFDNIVDLSTILRESNVVLYNASL
jgi:VWFA-related protein